MWTGFTCLNGAMCVSLSKVTITRKLSITDAIVGYDMLLGRVLDIDSENDIKPAELVLHDDQKC
jgi:CMP-N-acetylneuraminic acid synthetase